MWVSAQKAFIDQFLKKNWTHKFNFQKPLESVTCKVAGLDSVFFYKKQFALHTQKSNNSNKSMNKNQLFEAVKSVLYKLQC
jgi:hypothetical protein